LYLLGTDVALYQTQACCFCCFSRSGIVQQTKVTLQKRVLFSHLLLTLFRKLKKQI